MEPLSARNGRLNEATASRVVRVQLAPWSATRLSARQRAQRMHRSRTCTMRCRCTGGILCSPPARLRRFGGHPSRGGQFAVVLLPTLLTFEGGLPVHLRAPRYGGQPPPVGDVSSREGWLAGGSSLTNAGERTWVGQTGIEPGCGQITGVSCLYQFGCTSDISRHIGVYRDGRRRLTCGWLTSSPEIPVAKQRDTKGDDGRQADQDLTTGEYAREQRQQ